MEDFKNGCKLVTKGKCVDIMFTLDVNMPEVQASMFAQGAGVVADVDMWHKRICHVNEQRLRSMQSKQIVAGLTNFRVDGMHKVCSRHVNLASSLEVHFCKNAMYVRCHLRWYTQMYGAQQRQ